MTLEADKDFAILIPAYNEEKTILKVIMPLLDLSDHIIVVADGCTDYTIQAIQHLPVIILKNEQNEGKGACLQKGFSYLKGKPLQGVITLDADGQHDPEDIKHIINGFRANPNALILGARQDKKYKCPLTRYYANTLADFFISLLLGQKIDDSQSGFRFYPQTFIEKNRLSTFKRFGYESELLFIAKKNKFSIVNAQIQALYPENSRKSYYKPIADSATILFILLSYPLKNVLGVLRRK